jgi:hypothetical protein
MFVLEPDVEVQVMQLANGQMAIVIDANLTLHAHKECHEQVIEEVFGELRWQEEDEEDYRR